MLDADVIACYLSAVYNLYHICVDNLTIIDSDNGLSPGRRQAIIWTNVGILLIGLLGTNFSEMLIEIHTFSFKKIHLKMSSGKWRPFCLGLNVLTIHHSVLLTLQYIPYWSAAGYFNTLRPKQNGTPFRIRHFQMHFLEWKRMNFA